MILHLGSLKVGSRREGTIIALVVEFLQKE